MKAPGATAFLFLIAGCAHLQTSKPADCGSVGGMAVTIQYPNLISCPQALREVELAEQASGIPPAGWNVLFVGVTAGFAFSATTMSFSPADGKTFQSTRTVWVSAIRPHILGHEMRHVRDIKLGTSTVVDY